MRLQSVSNIEPNPLGAEGLCVQGILPPRAALPLALALLLAILSISQTGCVTRRLTIRSNPPGALVYVDNYEIGTTPCSTSFTYYGTREIRLVKDGYETVTVKQPIPAPWYQWPGIDFVSENLVTRDIRDHRMVTYDMQPQMVVPNNILLTRAEELRRDAFAPAVPLGGVAPAVGPGLVPGATLAPGPTLIHPLMPPGQPPSGIIETLPPPQPVEPRQEMLPYGGREPMFAPPVEPPVERAR